MNTPTDRLIEVYKINLCTVCEQPSCSKAIYVIEKRREMCAKCNEYIKKRGKTSHF